MARGRGPSTAEEPPLAHPSGQRLLRGRGPDANVSLVGTGACGGGPVFASAPLGLAHVSGAVPPLSLAHPPPPSAGGGGVRGGGRGLACRHVDGAPRLPRVPPRTPAASRLFRCPLALRPPSRRHASRGHEAGVAVCSSLLLSGGGSPTGTVGETVSSPTRIPASTPRAPAPCCPRTPLFGVFPPVRRPCESGAWAGGGEAWRGGSPAAHGAGGIRPLHPGECGSGWGAVARVSAGLLITWRGPGDRWGPPLCSGHRRACTRPARARGPHEGWVESVFFFFSTPGVRPCCIRSVGLAARDQRSPRRTGATWSVREGVERVGLICCSLGAGGGAARRLQRTTVEPAARVCVAGAGYTTRRLRAIECVRAGSARRAWSVRGGGDRRVAAGGGKARKGSLTGPVVVPLPPRPRCWPPRLHCGGACRVGVEEKRTRARPTWHQRQSPAPSALPRADVVSRVPGACRFSCRPRGPPRRRSRP